MSELWIGTSGYVYPHWRRGCFTPRGCGSGTSWPGTRRVPDGRAEQSVLPLPSRTFGRWHEAVPEGFVFAVKASRYITHVSGSRHAEPLAFLDRASRLGPKLGPILFQLPPTFQADPALPGFLASSPRSRWVIEFRHPSWHRRVYQALGAGVALCVRWAAGSGPTS